MKKVLAILSIAALVSCNGNGASDDLTKVDSVVVADTVVVADSMPKADSVELSVPQSESSEVK